MDSEKDTSSSRSESAAWGGVVQPLRIGVIGGGAAALGAAWLLSQRHEVTLFERADHIGGHVNTIDIEMRKGTMAVDSGFVVFSAENYPNLRRLLAWLDVSTQTAPLSFSVSNGDQGMEFAGPSLRSLFARKRNLLHPEFWRLLRDMARFHRQAPSFLGERNSYDFTLEDYVKREGYNPFFVENYLLPAVTAVLSAPEKNVMGFPALTMIRFFANHGFLELGQMPVWRTVAGGAREYIRRLVAACGNGMQVLTGTRVLKVERQIGGVKVHLNDGRTFDFDHVVIGTHANDALDLLETPSRDEKEILGAFSYQKTVAVLHRDTALMPKDRSVWASWNYIKYGEKNRPEGRELAGKGHSITYWLNHMHAMDETDSVFLSVNPHALPRKELIIRTFGYMHPVFDMAAIEAQRSLWRLRGADRIWFCGAYFGYGFHEDALVSGLRVAESLGVKRPWLDDLTTQARALDADGSGGKADPEFRKV